MNSLFRNSIFNLLSQIIIFFSAFILSVFLARILGPEQMGQYSYWMWLIGTGTVLLTLGIPRSLMRFTAQYKSSNETEVTKIISSIFIWQIKILTVLSIGLAIPIIIFGGNLKLTYFIILATLVIGVLNSIIGSSLAGLQRYNMLLKMNLLISPITFILSITVLFFFYNLTNLLAINLLLSFISLLVSIYYLRDHLKLNSKKIPAKIFSKIKSYSLSISVIVFLDLILMERSEIFFLKTFSSLEQVAFYSIGFGLVGRVMTLIPGAVSGVIMPKIASLHGQKNVSRIKLTYFSSTRYLILITFPIIFAGAMLIDLPVNIFYGADYEPVIPVIKILLISGGLSAVAAGGSSVLYGIGKQNFILKLAVFAVVINLLLDFLLIPPYGAIGGAFANFTAQVIGVIIGVYYLVRIKKMIFPWKDGFKIFFAGLISIIFVFFIKNEMTGSLKNTGIIIRELVVLGGVFITVFFINLYAFKFFNKQDLDIVNRILKKLPISYEK